MKPVDMTEHEIVVRLTEFEQQKEHLLARITGRHPAVLIGGPLHSLKVVIIINEDAVWSIRFVVECLSGSTEFTMLSHAIRHYLKEGGSPTEGRAGGQP